MEYLDVHLKQTGIFFGRRFHVFTILLLGFLVGCSQSFQPAVNSVDARRSMLQVESATIESVNGASIPATSQIVDAASNVWEVNSGVIYVNGKKAGFSSNVILLAYINGVIYQESASHGWWAWTGTTWNGVKDPRVVSANNTTIPNATLIVDSELNLWSLSSGVVYENGLKAGYSSGVIELDYRNSVVYQENASHNSWSWNGTAWLAVNATTSTPPTPIAPPEIVQNLGYTDPPVFYDDFSNFDTIDMADSKTKGFNWYVSSPGHTQDMAHITQVTYDGTPMLRLDGAGAFIQGGQIHDGQAVGPAFTVKNGGGAYFEANIAYGEPTSSTGAWPAFWVTSQNHMVNLPQPWGDSTHFIHYLEMDIMEYFHNNSYGTHNSHATLIDWFGVYNSTCGDGFCKVQNGQFLPLGQSGSYTSATESALVFHRYGAFWQPSLPLGDGTYTQGYVQWFLDGQPAGNKILFNGAPPLTPQVIEQNSLPDWTYSVMDSEPLSMVLDTGSGAFMYVNYVTVFQCSTSSCSQQP